MLSNQSKLERIESNYTKTQLFLRDLYLEHINDYIGYSLFAEHKGISEDTIKVMIMEGRAIHNDITAQYKQATA